MQKAGAASPAGTTRIFRKEVQHMTLKEARSALMALQEKTAAYDHAMSVIYYDGNTSAPKGTAANRGRSLGVLSEEMYKLQTGKDTVKLLEYLDAHKARLTPEEKRMVFLMLKDIRYMQKIPMEEYIAFDKLLVEADDVWHRAKDASDFALFEPYLQQIFDTTRRFAGYQDPEKDPYDYWLNEFEEGLSKEKCDAFFGALKERLVPLIAKVGKAKQVSDACIKGDFPEDKQEELSWFLMKLIGLDLDHVGLSTTEHPFTTSLGSHLDERITTHYYREDVSFSLYSVVHEGGHALYDTGSKDEYAFTVLDGGVSMGIHESQSRFYENILGRSRAFCYAIQPELRKLFPKNFAKASVEDIYKAVNKVQPSLIRTEADEVTYSLHVMIRYELEKRVMAGELAVHHPVLRPSSEYIPYTPDRILRKEEGALYVFYELGKDQLKRSFAENGVSRDNGPVLDEIVEITSSILKDTTSSVSCIQVIGLSSIDGSEAANERLALARAQSLKEYMQERLTIPENLFEVVGGGEAWTEFRDQVNDLLLAGGGAGLSTAQLQEVLDIIDNQADVNLRERSLKALEGGAVYANLKNHVMADQRNSGYIRVYFDYVPDQNALAVNHAIDALEAGEPARALEILNTVKDDVRSRMARVSALLRLGREEEGVALLREAVAAGDTGAAAALASWEEYSRSKEEYEAWKRLTVNQ